MNAFVWHVENNHSASFHKKKRTSFAAKFFARKTYEILKNKKKRLKIK